MAGLDDKNLFGSVPRPNTGHSTIVNTNFDETIQEIENDSSDSVRTEQVAQLARQISKESLYGTNLFNAPKDSKLDPYSDNFSVRDWAKALVNLMRQEPENNPPRTTGVAFENLSVHGFGSDTDFQPTVGNSFLSSLGSIKKALNLGQRRIQILDKFDGLVESGDMLLVLGPPGSGCSTFLKTLSGETNGVCLSNDSYLNYKGISNKQMHTNFRGESIYTAEVDVHFPNLTVSQTLEFAAKARAPRNPPGGVSQDTYAKHFRDVIMAMFGITHTFNTKVGNDFIRGVSGGERKRVTISEAALSGAPFQCWDNSTRGLDSANAIEFCKSLALNSEISETVSCVAIYQAPQAAYDIFNKVTVLYEGRQIYFGRTDEAKQFFIEMGFKCPDRQTTPDFLTSLTSPAERIVRPGFEGKVPRTPDEFAAVWKASEMYLQLTKDINRYKQDHPIDGPNAQEFLHSRRMQQARFSRSQSEYTLSYWGQVKLCLHRGMQRLRSDPTLTLTALGMNTISALLISSIFYNLPMNTDSFFRRGALLFFAVLMNAFGSVLEMLTLYEQRPIVEKHARYAFYHPSAEAIASMITDLPYKIVNSIAFNIVIYFMTNLRREPGPFFFYFLIMSFVVLTMSMMFRMIASISRTLEQALAPATVVIDALVIYVGFVLPKDYVLGWSKWILYINPMYYAFESLMINEFHDQNYECSTIVPAGPGYENITSQSYVCSSVGSRPGLNVVNGDDYINSQFQFYHNHKWRNFGILIAFMLFFMTLYLLATEYISAKKSKGEVLVFKRGYQPKTSGVSEKEDEESANGPDQGRKIVSSKYKNETEPNDQFIPPQTSIFHWQDVCYDIKIKGEHRRILDHVDGWVKPGTLTALMGVSGAGKTTLLDVLATRVTMGVVTGEMLVDGCPRDQSFQRKTGYVQQQDLHLSTSTVREALNFSAILRQPAHVPLQEKKDYVEQVIKLLEMEEYSDAVVGVPGEGLNVEQRKRLTIGVELVAKPQLLLFLDEPTSGLDSQTSWAICDLMEKLMKNGQAILCTIHQPSAMLFQRFDRLLFLARGGKTVYFGEVGENSSKLTDYFERNGANPCPPDANPAEWMLEVIGAAPGSSTDIDWPQVWNMSPEKDLVRQELADMKQTLPNKVVNSNNGSQEEKNEADYREFAAPFSVQLWQVLKRVFEQYWRTPSYIYSKACLCIASSLFIGFSFFKANNTIQGLQNQMFALFILLTLFNELAQQIMPNFVVQRSLYEVRERPSKAFSWKAFMLSNILVELPWNALMAAGVYFTWYYPVGLYNNAQVTDAVTERGAVAFLFIFVFLVFSSTFSNMAIAAIDLAETAANVVTLVLIMMMLFCGVLVPSDDLPGFWIFMYRVSPFTYLVDGLLSTAVANAQVSCADNEFVRFEPSDGLTCGEYMGQYITNAGTGYLQDENATSQCGFCSISSTNDFLSMFGYSYDNIWRNFGLMWVYIVFNIAAAVFLYWLVRVPKKSKAKEGQSPSTAKEK